MITVPTSISNMLSWQAAHLGQLVYSQSDPHRLSHDDAHMLSPTDCSGLVARLMAHFAGLDVGTYTGNEYLHGTLVTASKSVARTGYGMLPGDCILYNWYYDPDGPYNHINMYAGNGVVYNHGGPEHGPVRQSLSENVDGARHIMVRRFVHWPTTPPHPPMQGHPNNPMNGHPVPALIARGTGDFYGLASDPRNECHGGYYESERPAVRLIEEFLRWWYPNPSKTKHLVVDGRFGETTKELVTLFQKNHMPRTTNFGEVWFDDWAKMASL